MRTLLRRLLARLRAFSPSGAAERRTASARERFWADVDEGKREAEAESRN